MPLPAADAPGAAPAPRRSDWATLSRLFPYLWQYKWRVGFALAFMDRLMRTRVALPATARPRTE